MKKLFFMVVLCCAFSTVAFSEQNKETQGPQMTTGVNQACDLNTLNAEQQRLLSEKKAIMKKIIAVRDQIRHCKGPGKVTKRMMEQSKTKKPM